MAGRAAIHWLGFLALGVAVSLGPVRAVAQPATPPGQPPVDPFREPPFSPFLPKKPLLDPDTVLADGARVNVPASAKQIIKFSRRYGVPYNSDWTKIDENTNRLIAIGGMIVSVSYESNNQPQEMEFAADNVVAWVKNAKEPPSGSANVEAGGKTEVEMYLSGNVVIRSLSQGSQTTEQVIRACEIYYDVSRSRAIAMAGDLELITPAVPEPVHLRAAEIWQLGPNEFRGFDTEIYSSKLPANPGLRLVSNESTFTRTKAVRKNIFGIPYRNARTGETEMGYDQILTNRGARMKILDVPISYFPRLKTDINDPLGPLAGFGMGNDRIFGFQAYTTWDIYKLLALKPPNGHRWILHADYMSLRGPALGTDYSYDTPDFLGFGKNANGLFRLYGLHDRGVDVLGGDRGTEPVPPEYRYRLQWRHNQELYESGTTYLRYMGQVANFSDKNFFEQYYKMEFDFQPNQETFAYVYGARGNRGGSLLVQENLQRDWITETEWSPRADGYIIGQSLLDRFTYTVRGSAGYAGLRPAEVAPFSTLPTDQRVDTGRFDVIQKLDAPFDLGPFRFDPYGIVDLTAYTSDLTGESRGRFYGGGGSRVSTTLSRLYPNAESDLFNVRGLYHKMNLSANYLAAYSDTPYTQLPFLDRLSDDATDFAYRNFRPKQLTLIPTAGGLALTTSPRFDPQQYAIRRNVENKTDTLDTLQVVQLRLDQRLQTKRGFPGSEHTVDWMTLNLSMSVFPDKDRDNYGNRTAFLEYSYLWHVGDRFSLSSAGWYDPVDQGARYFNVGAYFNRPDGTYYALTYRHTDPVNSRAVTAAVTYNLTKKYAVNVSSTYDFGTNLSLSNSLNVVRVGTDVTIMFGFTYNALVNNFGLQFALVPNLAGLSASQLAFSSPFQSTGR